MTDLVTQQLACGPLDLGAWLDDPPRVVLRAAYLDALRELPLSHLAVMLDGPRPGLGDVRWTARELEQLAVALPELDFVLTAWAAPQAVAIGELRRELPELLDALGAAAIEVDTEPVGEWALRGVRGFEDAGGDKGPLDEAADALAEVLLGLGVDVEVTVFPGALRHVRSLLRALSLRVGMDNALRLVLQLYSVRTRGSAKAPQLVEYASSLGPDRLPAEAITSARRTHPGVELVAGLAAYDQRFPGRKPSDCMRAAVASASGTGVLRVRWWSAKHIVRLSAKTYAAPAIESLRSVSLRG